MQFLVTVDAHLLHARVVAAADPARAVSRAGFFAALRDDPAARAALTALVHNAPFPGLCLETPPLSAATAALPAELVLVRSDALLAERQDASPFAPQLRADRAVCTFRNLGGDALLVVPHPAHAERAAHLAEFVRHAAPALVDTFWATLGAAVLDEAARRTSPLWVSTAGLGVAWLHARLDSRPKYYRHRPYVTP